MSDRTCPVCGFENEFEPYPGGTSSQEICPSCGTQFGYDDHASSSAEREVRQASLRASWIAAGMKWWSPNPPPPDWDPQQQVRRVIGR